MDSMTAFAMGQASRGKETRVFDWDEAARRIRAAGAQEAAAGLSEDWEWTGGDILKNGSPVPKDGVYAYLASTWATPELCIDGVTSACFKMQSDTPGWDCETYWPDSARAILSA